MTTTKERNNELYNTTERSSKALTVCLVSIFLVLCLVGIFNHEMWRDELHVWIMARDSASLTELFKNMRYDGHTALWYVCVYFLTRFTRNPLAMQVFHSILATCVVYIFISFSPFNKLQKILFCFSYFTFYEYAVISRDYALGILCIFAFCAAFPSRKKSYLLLSLILAILLNTSIYGALVATAMAVTLATELVLGRKIGFLSNVKKLDVFLSILIFILGMAIAILSVLPPADTAYSEWVTEFNKYQLSLTLQSVVSSYVPIPKFFSYHFWNTNLFSVISKFLSFSLIFGVGLLTLSIGLFARTPFVLLLYILGSLELLLFTYTKYIGSLRHHGHLFILFIACLWLSSYYKEITVSNRFIRALTNYFNQKRNKILTGILCIHAIAGTFAYSMDLLYPFSASKEAAKFIKQQGMGDVIIAGGSFDHVISTLSGWLDTEIYYGQTDRFGTFVIFDKVVMNVVSDREILERVSQVIKQRQKDVLLVFNHQLKVDKDDLSISKLSEFTQSIVGDEVYYLYLVRPKTPVR